MTSRILLAVFVFMAQIFGAMAEFNGCGPGICGGGGGLGAADGGFNAGGVPTVVSCVPGNSTGQFDFSVCSNLNITAAILL